jgi:UDP-N-acetylmuramate dehydrogenase
VVEIQENVPLKDHTTIKVGGNARYFCVANSVDEMIDAYLFGVERNLETFFLGYGSNVLVSDKGYDGLVIKVMARKIEYEDGKIFAEAGALMSDVLNFALKGNAKLQGFEWAVGLPGTVAGAVYGNSGCNGGCTADIVERVFYFNGSRIVSEKMSPNKFDYRYSMFKHYKVMITGVEFKEMPRIDNFEEITRKITEFTKRRAETQPRGVGAGCIFKNPLIDGQRISAGLIIDLAGYKGVHFPSPSVYPEEEAKGAMISDKHANFFLNLGEAFAFDFRTLIITSKAVVRHRSKQVLEKLSERFNKEFNLDQTIELEEEINLLGDFDYRGFDVRGSRASHRGEKDMLRRDDICGRKTYRKRIYGRNDSSPK